MTPLGVASKPLRDANANILVIGIGKQPDIRELNLITKNPKGVEIIPSPNEVIINVHLLSKKLRQDATKGKRNVFILIICKTTFTYIIQVVLYGLGRVSAGRRTLFYHSFEEL